MDEEQIDVVEAERGQRAVKRGARVVGAVEAVVELARDEDLASVEAEGANRLADAALVAVHLRGVDMPVADLEGLRDGFGGVAGRDLKDAEAELWDGVTVVEVDGRHGGRAFARLLSRCVHAHSVLRITRGCPTTPS